MDHDEIEQEVKRENDRKWQADQDAAKRKHELDMSKAGRKHVDYGDLFWAMMGVGAFTWIVAGTTCHHIGSSSARETDAEVMDISHELRQCRRRFDSLAARAGKGKG